MARPYRGNYAATRGARRRHTCGLSERTEAQEAGSRGSTGVTCPDRQVQRPGHWEWLPSGAGRACFGI